MLSAIFRLFQSLLLRAIVGPVLLPLVFLLLFLLFFLATMALPVAFFNSLQVLYSLRMLLLHLCDLALVRWDHPLLVCDG